MLSISPKEYRFFQAWSKGQIGMNCKRITQLRHQNKESLKDFLDFEQFVKLITEGFTPTDIKNMYNDNILTVTK